MPLGCGITNLVDRATSRADELDDDQLVEGARLLERKVRRYRPACVAMVGITAFRKAFDRPKAEFGRHDRDLAGALVWLLPSTSGLNAHYQAADFAKLFGQLRRAFDAQA